MAASANLSVLLTDSDPDLQDDCRSATSGELSRSVSCNRNSSGEPFSKRKKDLSPKVAVTIMIKFDISEMRVE